MFENVTYLYSPTVYGNNLIIILCTIENVLITRFVHERGSNLYHVVSSKYTSCDLDHPHYFFYSDNIS